MKRLITVAVESPYAGDVPKCLAYLRLCLRFCLTGGDGGLIVAPFASHGLYTLPGVLDDLVPEERRQGIHAGFQVAERLEERWAFLDFGVSPGMAKGLGHARTIGQPVREFRIRGWARGLARRDVRVRGNYLAVWPEDAGTFREGSSGTDG